ncbi:amino acid permease/ SLC12A domain-containing protein [Penicillium manginii]|uniref:amino acid permease/ SLC12A domain-containing protein n=1 Tax=Penicillium manginii TaxID=203109 RepID=UPI002548A04B|nr:amino acid permease/ SLC12A domain-containing protein [Penicillium manginii]KAJ5750601.1 amino acid permease/ SLC12A domain-containing protein [Penicillium manginii]
MVELEIIQAQHVDKSSLPFSFPLQPFSTYFTLGYLCIIAFFNGLDYTAGGWSTPGFITFYTGFPLLFGFILLWKLFKKTQWIRSEDADLFSGKAELDAVE